MLERLAKDLDRAGLFWVGVIFTIVCGNAIYLARAIFATWIAADPGILTVEGLIRGNDFIGFWAAADVSLQSQAGSAYDMAAIDASLHRLSGLENWPDRRLLYPPTYLLMMLPLGLLPYLPALAVWQALPLLGFLLVMGRMGLPRLLYWLLPLSAAVVQTIVTGQNGLLSALILAGGLLNLERFPVLAGVLFALITYKPQLALLVAPVLVIGHHWRALGAMAAASAVLVMASLAAFGLEAWLGFFGNVSYAQDQLAQGHAPWARMPTVFAAARLIGMDAAPAWILQGLVALGVVAGVAWAWWRPLPYRLKAAVLVAAIPLTTPWAHDYDLVILLLPIAWLILEARGAPLGFLEIAVMVLVWMLPAWWMLLLVQGTGVSPGPLVLLAFYGMVLNRARRGVGIAGRSPPSEGGAGSGVRGSESFCGYSVPEVARPPRSDRGFAPRTRLAGMASY